MLCENCGTKLEDNAKSCASCGWQEGSDVAKAISSLEEQAKKVKVVTEYGPETLVDEMETIVFGSYPQSDASGKEKEPIEWIVLEKNDKEILLLSKYILDCKCYNDEEDNVTWETCSLRKWFNDTFYNKAFNDDEKKMIIKSNVVNKENSKYCAPGGNDTSDYVYSLSIEECRKYFGNEDVNYSNKRLAAKGTEYAKNVDNHGEKLWASDNTNWFRGNSEYWLRTPGGDKEYGANVDIGGGVGFSGYPVDTHDGGCRPLLRVKYK